MKKEIKEKLINLYEKMLVKRHYKDSNTKIIEERIKELKRYCLKVGEINK